MKQNGKGTTTQDVSFRKQGMSAKEISSFCFPQNGGDDKNMTRSSSPLMDLQFDLSKHVNSKLLSQQTSREGRSSQRWSWTPTAAGSNESTPVRLTTGCVPICQDGKILLVSASRKAEWVIPKGGWENDESMEESALRETLEEAGAMGIIGSRPLASVEVETRKARKRRLTNNSQQPTTMECNNNGSESEDTCSKKKIVTRENSSVMDPSTDTDHHPSLVVVSNHRALEQIGDLKRKQMDEACSSVSSSSSSTAVVATPDDVNYNPHYTHVRLTMFPLYVTNVLDSWPEDQRIRRIVDIDEAIQILQNRPELQSMVLKVKEQNLHLRTPVVTA